MGTGLRPFYSFHTGLEFPGSGEWCEFPGPPGCWDTGAPSHLATDHALYELHLCKLKVTEVNPFTRVHTSTKNPLSLLALGFPGYSIRDFSALLLKPQSLASLTDESYRQNTGEEDRTMGIKLHI